MAIAEGAPYAGALLREWRQRRNLSLIETGRARPSREMVLRLAECLDVPLRERNHLLLAAGFAPAFGERSLDESEMAPVREALERFLSAHEPYPALVVDHYWNIVAANRGVVYVTQGVAAELLTPPANALRIALHPEGMAPRISNLAEWSGYLIARLRREIEATRDPDLESLYKELVAYPGVTTEHDRANPSNPDSIMLMHELRLADMQLALFSTLTTFGTARDLTLEELTIEAFYPANPQTAETLSAAVSEARPD
jgi:transcriptional regulator with XRE-family HTH domain